MALGSNCTGDNLLPISSVVLVAGAWGYSRGQVSGWPFGFIVAPCGERELWALSLAGQKPRKWLSWGNSVAHEPLFIISLSLEIRVLGHLIPHSGKPRGPSCDMGWG